MATAVVVGVATYSAAKRLQLQDVFVPARRVITDLLGSCVKQRWELEQRLNHRHQQGVGWVGQGRRSARAVQRQREGLGVLVSDADAVALGCLLMTLAHLVLAAALLLTDGRPVAAALTKGCTCGDLGGGGWSTRARVNTHARQQRDLAAGTVCSPPTCFLLPVARECALLVWSLACILLRDT